MGGILNRLAMLVLPSLVVASPVMAKDSPARGWVLQASGQVATWSAAGTLVLPSGAIFIGDPSWGGDFHMRGAQKVAADRLEIWLLADLTDATTHAVWLEALGTEPVALGAQIDFGMDSAYFAFGDLSTGQDLASIGDLGLAEAPDSFEFLLPHVQKPGFSVQAVPVPPKGALVHLVNTSRDGGVRAVWLLDASGGLSGILIDLSGRAADNRFIDTLLETAH